MANIYSLKSGLASDATVWSSGTVPVQGDRVLISATHDVTLDGDYTWGDDSTSTISINGVSTTRSITVLGTITHSRVVSSSLTCYGTIGILLGGKHDIGTESDPIPDGITAGVFLNKSATLASNKYRYEGLNGCYLKYWGAFKKRTVQLTANASVGATTIQVSDATGWKPGDQIVLAQTDMAGMRRQEIRTIDSGYTAGALTVPLTAALTYSHAVDCYVGNYSSNVFITNFNNSFKGIWYSNNGYASNGFGDLPDTREFGNCSFLTLGSTHPWNGFALMADANYTTTPHSKVYRRIYNVAVYTDSIQNMAQTPTFWIRETMVIEDMLYVSSAASNGYVQVGNHTKYVRPVCFNVQLFTGGFSDVSFEDGIHLSHERTMFTTFGSSLNRIYRAKVGGYHINTEGVLFSVGAQYHIADVVFDDCDFGVSIPLSPALTLRYIHIQSIDNRAGITAKDCVFASNILEPTSAVMGNMTPESYVFINNKNKDITKQELYTRASIILRENATTLSGVSSLSIRPNFVGTLATRNQSITCANGQTIRVVGYVRLNSLFYNSGDCNYPTVTLSGLGATPVVFTSTSAANEAWQKYDLSITNTSGFDGEFTLTMSASAKTVTTGTVYFDGVPDSPFITKVRHYGFEFDETNPTRKVNPYTVADEATASAYTGVTINPTTERVSFGIGNADTFQKVYDYSQAWGASNIDKDIPWTRAGALLSINPDWVVVDPSITGVTWGSGIIEFNVPGNISGSFDSCTLRFNTVGTYDLSNGLFAGTIHLENTSPGQVIVIVLPSGIDYVNNDPMNITVQVAVQQATGSITNIVPGSRLQVYNVTTATEMVNQIVSGTSYTTNYPTGTGYTAGDLVRVRLTYCSGLTAKLPVEYKTIATSSGWTVLADQKNDEVYILNGIDGSTVTEYTADYLNVQIDLADGDNSTTIQRGYNWYCDQMTGDLGIAQYFGAMYAEDTLNYVLDTDVMDIKIQNTNLTNGVTITGGALRRKDGSSPIAPGGSVYFYYGRTYGVETGVSGLTPTESDKLLSLPDATTVSNSVWNHVFTQKLLTITKFLGMK